MNSQLNTAGWEACPLVQNPLKKYQFLTLNGHTGDNSFAVFDMRDNSVSYGKSLTYGVTRPFVVMIDEKYFKDHPYFYVLLGLNDDIQRLDLSTSDDITTIDWEVLTSVKVTQSNSACDITDWGTVRMSGGLQYNNLIYIIGGYSEDTTNDESCILSFDFVNKEIEYVGDFPIGISRYAITYVCSNKLCCY